MVECFGFDFDEFDAEVVDGDLADGPDDFDDVRGRGPCGAVGGFDGIGLVVLEDFEGVADEPGFGFSDGGERARGFHAGREIHAIGVDDKVGVFAHGFVGFAEY